MNIAGMRYQLRDALLRPAARFSRKRTTSDSDTILIFQPDHLGDILLSQPAVNRVRDQFPNHRLVGVVGPWSESIARLVWQVDDIVTIDFPGFDRTAAPTNPAAPYRQLRRAASSLEHLDACVSFVLRPDAWWTAWLASLVTGGPVVTSDDARVAPFGTQHACIDTLDHAVVRALAISNALEDHIPANRIYPESVPLTMPKQPGAESIAKQFLQGVGVESEYVVIHPGAGAAVKQWPMNRWRHIAGELASTGLPVVVTGAQSESNLARMIAGAGAHVTSIAGQTPLPVLIEILRRARLVLGPDSGPLHVAVACDTPTVHLFGPSEPARYGPWGSPKRHRVIDSNWSCSRCGDLSLGRDAGCGCMAAIQTDMVWSTAIELLDADAH